MKTCKRCGGAILPGAPGWGGPICYCQQAPLPYTDELDRLRAEVASLQAKLDSAINVDIRWRDNEIKELQEKKFTRFNDKECWIYQGDGQDNLQSLACPVVIAPEALLDLTQQLAAAKEQNALLTVQVEQMRQALQQIAEDKYLPSDDPGYWKQRWQEIARAALSAPQQVKSEDARRLDSGSIRLTSHDEDGDVHIVTYRGIDLRSAIDAAISAQEEKA